MALGVIFRAFWRGFDSPKMENQFSQNVYVNGLVMPYVETHKYHISKVAVPVFDILSFQKTMALFYM